MEESDCNHEIDINSVSVVLDGDAYIDVSCKHCGASGCFAVIKEEDSNQVDW